MFDNGDDVAEPPVRRSKIADLADWRAPEVPPAPREVPESVPVMASGNDPVAVARREFAVLLGEFRRMAVLVPLDEVGDLWSAEQCGVRWICAFSDEEALARFAQARGDAGREWTYQ
ncbi:SseB family protein, partial [Streptomyces sp. NPDC087228]